MKHLFFLFVGFFAVYETLKAFGCKKLYARRREYRMIVKKDDKSLIEEFYKGTSKASSCFDFRSWRADNVYIRFNDKSMDFVYKRDVVIYITFSTSW